MMKRTRLTYFTLVTMLFALAATQGVAKAKVEPVKLTPEGEKALTEYTGLHESLRADLKGKMPTIDKEKADPFMATPRYKKDDPKGSKGKKDAIAKPGPGSAPQNPKPKLSPADAAKRILPDIEAFLRSDAMDNQLVACAVLANATPRRAAWPNPPSRDRKRKSGSTSGSRTRS
jgi:hypothetical protein